VEVARGEVAEVRSTSPQLSDFVRLAEELGISHQVPERFAQLHVVLLDKVFRVLRWVGVGGGIWALSLPVLVGGPSSVG